MRINPSLLIWVLCSKICRTQKSKQAKFQQRDQQDFFRWLLNQLELRQLQNSHEIKGLTHGEL